MTATNSPEPVHSNFVYNAVADPGSLLLTKTADADDVRHRRRQVIHYSYAVTNNSRPVDARRARSGDGRQGDRDLSATATPLRRSIHDLHRDLHDHARPTSTPARSRTTATAHAGGTDSNHANQATAAVQAPAL